MQSSSSFVASSTKEIRINRYFNMISLYRPEDNRVHAAFVKRLSVLRKVSSRERNKFMVEFIPEPFFKEQLVDGRPMYVMGFGLYAMVEEILKSAGYEPYVVDIEPLDMQGFRRLLPNKNVIERIRWREDQKMIVKDLATVPTAQYMLSTGAGKSFMLRKLCEVFDKARIVLTTCGKGLLDDLYREMIADGRVDVGIYHSDRRHEYNGRVLLCSVGMLQHFCDREFDVLLLDEKHECGTLARIDSLLSVNCRRAYAFSAEHDSRADQADGWLKVAFGELRSRITHAESVAAGDIVPVKVEWVKVDVSRFPDYNPASVQFLREAYWNNSFRNAVIASMALSAAENGQTLVYASSVEHAYRLKKLLGCPVVHAVQNADNWKRLQDMGVVGIDEVSPTAAQLLATKKAMISGKLPLAICNSVWRRGVDFVHLRTLVRADGSASTTDATQISGRLTRKSAGKEFGRLIDFWDVFHDAAFRKSRVRRQLYKGLGYAQDEVPK